MQSYLHCFGYDNAPVDTKSLVGVLLYFHFSYHFNCGYDFYDFVSSVGASEDIRPGVAMSRQAKRAHELEKRKLELKKHQKENKKLSQKERLTEGLNTAIDSSNKGFAMLQKMGYKPGTSLGKEGNS